jgi:hypothetical protein
LNAVGIGLLEQLRYRLSGAQQLPLAVIQQLLQTAVKRCWTVGTLCVLRILPRALQLDGNSPTGIARREHFYSPLESQQQRVSPRCTAS